MNKIRIIGIGSPFGDDRIGWEAIEAIDRSGMIGSFPADTVATFCCSQPAADLLPMLSGAGAAILIDAVKSGAAPGALCKVDASALRADAGKISSHGLGVPESLALARMLGMLPATVMIYGIEIGGSGAQLPVGTDVRAAIPALLREIESEVRRLIEENG